MQEDDDGGREEEARGRGLYTRARGGRGGVTWRVSLPLLTSWYSGAGKRNGQRDTTLFVHGMVHPVYRC